MKLLPRYTFRSTDALCPHGDPDCLCDVHVGEPAPIRTDVPHMFHSMALQELDDYGVNGRNIVEFFSIVLGCHEIYRREVPEESEMHKVWTNVPVEGKKDVGPPQWRALSDGVRAAMRRHAYAGTPWSFACAEVEGLDDADMRAIRRFYNDTRRNNYHAEKRRPNRVPTACVQCGAEFLPLRADAKYCSHKCTMVAYRSRSTENTRRYRAANKEK